MKITIDVNPEPIADHINTEQDIIDWQCGSCRRLRGKDTPKTLPLCFKPTPDKQYCKKQIMY